MECRKGINMENHVDLSSIEIRQLILDALAYEGDDMANAGNNFKKYKYEGKQSDLIRLAENLAIKKNLIPNKVIVPISAWGGSTYALVSGMNTNFSKKNLKNIYEQFYILMNQGIIAPGADHYYGSYLPAFHVTEYGIECLKTRDILPYDIDGYLSKIKAIKNIDEWVQFYVTEALKCYNANCMEAAIIMLGLANEKIMKGQISSLLEFVKKYYNSEYQKMERELDKEINISNKYEIYTKYFNAIKGKEKRNPKNNKKNFSEITSLMDKLSSTLYANTVRITRNSMSHPNELKMERTEVLMLFISFIKYCEIQYEFINYFNEAD